MKVQFLFPYPLGQSPSQRFRFEQYFETMELHNISYLCQSFWNEKSWHILYKRGHYPAKFIGFLSGIIRRLWLLTKLLKVDFVFIHRECAPIGPPAFEWIIAKVLRKKIIYDFDDAIWLPNTTHENKWASILKWHSKTSLICKWSYKVSCGNEYLAEFAKRYAQNVVINPTTIDTEYFHNPALFKISRATEVINVGWTGSHSTLKYLDAIVPVFQQLEVEYSNLRFIVIANKKPNISLKSLIFVPWSKENEIKDLLQFDIGIMPLTNDLWAKGKCGFKALQYMALCIPTVASPVGVNSIIIEHNVNGFLCEKIEDWQKHLVTLIEQAELRKQIGDAARRKVIECYSVSSNTSSFLSLFE